MVIKVSSHVAHAAKIFSALTQCADVRTSMHDQVACTV